MPVFSTPRLVGLWKAPRAGIARMLSDLVETGVLTMLRWGRGRRAQIYSFPALLEIIDTESAGAVAAVEPTPQELTLLPAGET